MKYLILSLLAVSVNLSFGQIRRAYINRSGEYSSTPKNAVAYVLIEKLNSDSSFAANYYDINNNILIAGFYKDSLLTIPNGRFAYFHKNRPVNRHGKLISPPNLDTDNHQVMKGYFVNGEREGKWIQYADKGDVVGIYTYDHDKMNGPFKQFGDGLMPYWSEGTMSNDLIEGKFLVYSADSLLADEYDYFHGKEKKHITHLRPAQESVSFITFLEETLNKYRKQLKNVLPIVSFMVDKNGGIRDVKVIKGVNPEIDSAIVSAVSIAPAYTPAYYDGEPIDQKIVRNLFLFPDEFYVRPIEHVNIRPPRPGGITYYLYPGGTVGTRVNPNVR